MLKHNQLDQQHNAAQLNTVPHTEAALGLSAAALVGSRYLCPVERALGNANGGNDLPSLLFRLPVASITTVPDSDPVGVMDSGMDAVSPANSNNSNMTTMGMGREQIATIKDTEDTDGTLGWFGRDDENTAALASIAHAASGTVDTAGTDNLKRTSYRDQYQGLAEPSYKQSGQSVRYIGKLTGTLTISRFHVRWQSGLRGTT